MKFSRVIVAGVFGFAVLSGPLAMADETAKVEITPAPEAPSLVFSVKKEERVRERIPYNEKDFSEWQERQDSNAEAVRQAKAAADALFSVTDSDLLLSPRVRMNMALYHKQYEDGLKMTNTAGRVKDVVKFEYPELDGYVRTGKHSEAAVGAGLSW